MLIIESERKDNTVKSIQSTKQSPSLAMAILVALCLLGFMGCSSSSEDKSNSVDTIRVVPRRNGSAVALDAAAIFGIMKRCSFTDQQVYFHGMALRDALKNHGGAYIYVGEKKAEAVLKVDGENVLIYSLSNGYFVYDVKSGSFALGAQGGDSSEDSGRPAPR
jgi:hypothetical protein